jgi:hypothetical protein
MELTPNELSPDGPSSTELGDDLGHNDSARSRNDRDRGSSGNPAPPATLVIFNAGGI